MLEVVDEGINGVLIFFSIGWMPFVENSVFKLGDVALEAWLLWGVEVPVPVTGLSPAGEGPSLFILLDFVCLVDVLNLFRNNVEPTAFS